MISDPSQKASKRSILVADPDRTFLDSIQADPRTSMLRVDVAANGKAAQLLLADRNLNFAGIVVNPALVDTSGLAVIRFAHQTRPATPVFLIHDGALTIPPEEIARLGIRAALPKPITYSQIVDKVSPATVFFDPKAALDAAKGSTEAVDSEFSAEDAMFFAIRAEDFLAGSKSFFDVYVRLNSSRYLKILQSGDAFSPGRVQAYLEKGIINLYIKKEAQAQYVLYCEQISTALLKKKDVSTSLKISQTLNHGQEAMNFLKNHGISEANLGFAESFVSHVTDLVHQLQPDKNPLLKGFLADVAAYEHGVATATIAALLSKPLKFETNKPVHIVGLACLFHDVGLQKMSPEVQSEDESKMTDDQKLIYRTHPQIGAQILKDVQGLDPVVIQAVAQHHERRDKKGFPSKLGAGAINRIAEIVGISDEFVRLIKAASENPSIHILKEMDLRVFAGFSPTIVDAFRSIFFVEKVPPKPSQRR